MKKTKCGNCNDTWQDMLKGDAYGARSRNETHEHVPCASAATSMIKRRQCQLQARVWLGFKQRSSTHSGSLELVGLRCHRPKPVSEPLVVVVTVKILCRILVTLGAKGRAKIVLNCMYLHDNTSARVQVS